MCIRILKEEFIMPHSSGGGSHGGGSHGGSHHSYHSSGSHSGSSSVPARHAKSVPFEGATRYVYYRKHKPVFVYADYDISKKKEGLIFGRILMVLVLGIPSVLVMGLIMFLAGHYPKKLDTNYNTAIIIEDNLGVIKDEAALRKSLEAFYDTTGITPAVTTYPNSAWISNYDSLEDFAYDDYVNRFPDEKHWLIVYTSETKDDGFADWHWEGMQGDDTDPILGEKETGLFTDNLHKYLLQNKQYTVDAAIARAFDDLTPVAMKKHGDSCISPCCIVFEIFFLGIMLLGMDIHPVREKYYPKATVCDEKFVDQEACEYCDGIYIVGMHTSCPHCGAPVKPHDYYTDENGNIKRMIT